MAQLMAGPANKRPSTKELIQGHVFNCSGPDADCAVWGPTPFSSWTSDLHTALAFARIAWETDENEKPCNFRLRQYPRIAVLDTYMLSSYAETKDVRVYHTKAFANIFGEPDWDLRTEYLVYGRISGPAFHAIPVSRIQEVADLGSSCWWSPQHEPAKSVLSRHDMTEAEVLKAKRVAELFEREGEEQPDVVIAILAAELARLQWDTGMPLPYPKQSPLPVTWDEKDIDLVVEATSQALNSLSRMDESRRSLVNPRQCTNALPNVGMMVNMLTAIQAKIPPSSPSPSEKRRRSNTNRVSKTKLRKPGIAKRMINKMLKKK